MRRRLNLRLLLIVLAVFGAAAGAFHAVHVWQVGRNVASLLSYARTAKDEGKIDKAVDFYDQYLRLSSGDLDVREEVARLLDGIAKSPRDRARVVAQYEGLLLKSADRDAVRSRLVDNLILLGRYDAAVRHLDILRATWPNRAEIDHKRGWCLDAAGKPEEAATAYRLAAEHDPKRIASWLLLAETLYERLSRDADAQKSLDAMVAANPDSPAARLGRFRFLRRIGRDDDAARDLAEARRLAPDRAEVILAACQWAQSRGDFDQARDLAARGNSLFPANEAMIQELAALELRQGRRDLALKVLDDGIRSLANKTATGELHVFRADLLIDLGRAEEARKVVDALRKQGLAPALPDFLEARLLAAEKRWNEAQTLLEKSRKTLASDPYWSSRASALIGLCHGRLGDVDRQIESLLDASRLEPRWLDLNVALGQAYLDADKPEQALLHLAPLADLADAPRGVHSLIARARFRLAVQLPDKERPWKAIDAEIAAAAKRDPGSLDLAILRARSLEAQGKIDAARAAFEREVKKRSEKTASDDLPAWLALADFEARAGDDDRPFDVLEEAQKRFGGRVPILVDRARLLLQRGRTGDREAARRVADDVADLSPDDRGRLYRELAEFWLRHGDASTARSLLADAAALLPRDLRTRSLLIDLDLNDGRVDAAKAWLAEMRSIEGPKGSLSNYAALNVAVEDAFGQPDALRAILAGLKDSPLRRGDGRIELVEARIHDRLGESDRAAAKLLEAAYAGQRSPRVLKQLYRVLTQRQDYENLTWVIAQIEGRGPMPREIGRAAIDAALAADKIDQARELLGSVNLDAVRDYRELLWLGKTYRRLREPTLAEGSFRRAVALAPHAPDPWVALANHLIASGKRAKAVELAGDVERKAPAKSRTVVAARLREALGDLKDAEAAYQKTLAGRPNDFLVQLAAADFYRRADEAHIAETLYRKVLDPSQPTPPEVAGRARRGLALTLAARSPSEAAALGKLSNRGESADDRLDAFLAGLDPAGRDGAIRAFEATLSRGPLTADETFWLVQLFDAAGRFDEADSRFARLLDEAADTPQMLALYAQSLIRRGQVDRAREIVVRLRDREPDSPRSRRLVAALPKA